jgi:hypothetical protein
MKVIDTIVYIIYCQGMAWYDVLEITNALLYALNIIWLLSDIWQLTYHCTLLTIWQTGWKRTGKTKAFHIILGGLIMLALLMNPAVGLSSHVFAVLPLIFLDLGAQR